MANTDQDNPYNLLNLIRIQTVCFNCIFWPKSGFYAFLDQLNKNYYHVMVTRTIMVKQSIPDYNRSKVRYDEQLNIVPSTYDIRWSSCISCLSIIRAVMEEVKMFI